MKQSVATFALMATAAAIWSPSYSWALHQPQKQQQKHQQLHHDDIHGRRTFFTDMMVASSSLLFLPPTIASASLLDDFGSDPTSIQQKDVPPAIASPTSKKKSESVIEPNLRSNYYYPTNKKRYLPRIKKCSDAIPIAAENIGKGDWDAVQDFCLKIADDTILPMKLYVSSLLGGGTNVKVSYAKDMTASANDFEKNQKKLVTAILRQDPNASSQALEQMALALQSYRAAGNLLGPDGGGDIPSVDEIRRAASRTTGRLYGKTLEARDARVASSTTNGGGGGAAAGVEK